MSAMRIVKIVCVDREVECCAQWKFERFNNLYPATDAVNNEVPLPIHYRSGCIQTPAGVCCYRCGQKYPPMPVCAEEIKLL